jgi:hypothetical protein
MRLRRVDSIYSTLVQKSVLQKLLLVGSFCKSSADKMLVDTLITSGNGMQTLS